MAADSHYVSSQQDEIPSPTEPNDLGTMRYDAEQLGTKQDPHFHLPYNRVVNL